MTSKVVAQKKQRPELKGKVKYLRRVNAGGCIKNRLMKRYMTSIIIKPMSHTPKQSEKTQDEVADNKKNEGNKETKPNMTKLEQKIKFNEQKRVMKEY